MKEEFSGIIEALQFAIQMEVTGKVYYSSIGKACGNKAGKELYAWLAKQEDRHRVRFMDIFESLNADKPWPVKEYLHEHPATIFSEAVRISGTDIAASKEEFAGADKAIEMEIKSRDYYHRQADKAVSEVEKKFFSAIAAEEHGHYLSLIDYKEYITDPTGWFTRTEHHLLDGA